MKYLYPNIGKDICNDQEYLKQQYKALDWLNVEGMTSLPMSQGMAIKECIKEFRIPKVSHVAIHGHINTEENSTLGLYGIRGHYTNGTYDLCFVDNGIEITPIINIKRN